jgi:hypothetical protein
MGFKGHWMVFSKTRIKNSEEKPAALRNAQKPRAARAAFAQALYSLRSVAFSGHTGECQILACRTLYSKPSISEQNSAQRAPKLFPRFSVPASAHP